MLAAEAGVSFPGGVISHQGQIVMLIFILFFAAIVLTALITHAATLWTVHVARTGAHPLPQVPKITLFGRRHVDVDDEDESNNGQVNVRHRAGP